MFLRKNLMKLNDNVDKFNFSMMPLSIFYIEKKSGLTGNFIYSICGPYVLNTIEMSFKPMRRSDMPSVGNRKNIASLKIKTEDKQFDIYEGSPIVAFTELEEAVDFIKTAITKPE